jgi:cation diffusion facilitator family transporter
VIGFVGNEMVAVHRIRVGRRIGSAALVADGVHARTDGFTSLAVVLGVVGAWLGFRWADPIVGLVISASIILLLRGTARDICRRLLDGVDPALVDRAEDAVAALPGVLRVDQVRMRWMGHRLSVEASVTTAPEMPVSAFHALEHQADLAVRRRVTRVGTVRLSPSGHQVTVH